ncbi:PH domain-containing protein, partial [Breznakiellaceae bacterium SP9]
MHISHKNTACSNPSSGPTDNPSGGNTPDIPVSLDLSDLTTADAIRNAINAQAVGKTNNGSTANKALSLSVTGLNVTNAAAMQNLLNGIGASGKYVNLDLSGVTFAGNTFPDLSSVSTAAYKAKICSITLPNTVTT